MEYKPGESGVIKAFYNTGSHSGVFSKRIMVKSNSVKEPVLYLTLKGTVYADLEVKNNTAFFYDLEPGKTKRFDIPVINNMGKPFKIEGMKVVFPFNANNYFHIKATVKKGKNDKEFIEFAITPKSNVYQFRENAITVRLKTNSKQVPELMFYLRTRIKKIIEVTPTALFMYSRIKGKTAPATIELSTELKGGIKIKSVTCKNCPLRFKVVNISPKTKQILVKPDYEKGKKGIFSGVIKIIFEANGEKVYSIPVRGRL